jgi:hypothetical protein
MAYLIAAPDMLSVAAAEVAGIGSSVTAAHAAAATQTTGVLAAAEDEVSAAIATVFRPRSVVPRARGAGGRVS